MVQKQGDIPDHFSDYGTKQNPMASGTPFPLWNDNNGCLVKALTEAGWRCFAADDVSEEQLIDALRELEGSS